MSGYTCLHCGSKHGQDTGKQSEDWFWRLLTHGRIGPFCSQEHANKFEFLNRATPRFTVEEVETLLVLRERYRHDPYLDAEVGA